MIDLEKLRAIGEQHKRHHMHVSIHADEFMALLDYIAQLEKDAARLDFLETPPQDGQGLRYEVNCLVVNGVNRYAIYDDCEECFMSNGEWSSTTREAIDTAMEAKHG